MTPRRPASPSCTGARPLRGQSRVCALVQHAATALLLMLALLVVPVLGQATAQPAQAPPSSASSSAASTDNAPRLIQRNTARGPATDPASRSTGSSYWLRLGLSLALVIGVILLFRWGGARFLGVSTGARTSRAIQVVSRTPIAPRQHLMLVQVGRRLVLVGNSGTQMNSLCEITDPDEIAELLGRVQREKSETLTGAFTSMFRHAEEKFDDADAEPDEPAAVASGSSAEVEPEIVATREEINSLMEKVRNLSRNFRG